MAQKTDSQLITELAEGELLTGAKFEDLIDSKINKDNIVNNLTSGGVGVPLSAEQGKILDQKTANDIPTANTGESVQDIISDYLDYKNSRCILQLSTPQTINASDGGVVIAFDTGVDPMNWLDAMNYRWIPQIAGWYDVNFIVYYNTSIVADGRAIALIQKNSTQAFLIAEATSANGDIIGGLQVSGKVYCNGSTDYIDFVGAQNNQNSQTDNITVNETQASITLWKKD